MKRKTIISVIGFLIPSIIIAQTQFISKAKIEYERRINQWADLKGEFAEQIKKNTPQYKTDYFDYQFINNKSIYKPGRPSGDKPAFYKPAASDNTVFSDYNNRKYVAHKAVFERDFLIEDSLRNCTWRITNDFREIAGFNCRRATTVIMDSVFVVAFYTDEIMISGGPESFNGLPGIILGLVVNRLHTTWYATKVDVNIENEKEIVPPTQGKKTTNEELVKTLRSSFSNWGEYMERNIWTIMM
jgi:GLPGLI family protein